MPASPDPIRVFQPFADELADACARYATAAAQCPPALPGGRTVAEDAAHILWSLELLDTVLDDGAAGRAGHHDTVPTEDPARLQARTAGHTVIQLAGQVHDLGAAVATKVADLDTTTAAVTVVARHQVQGRVVVQRHVPVLTLVQAATFDHIPYHTVGLGAPPPSRRPARTPARNGPRRRRGHRR